MKQPEMTTLTKRDWQTIRIALQEARNRRLNMLSQYPISSLALTRAAKRFKSTLAKVKDYERTRA